MLRVSAATRRNLNIFKPFYKLYFYIYNGITFYSGNKGAAIHLTIIKLFYAYKCKFS